jgi:hypothetical protein
MVSLFEGAFYALSTIIIMFLLYCAIVFMKIWVILQKVLNKKVLSDYKPKTGDILMMQWRNAPFQGLIPYIKYFPTHAGLVWKRTKTNVCTSVTENIDEIYILEMNHFRQDANYYQYTQTKKKGLRLVKYYDYVDRMEGLIFVRQISEEIPSQIFESLLDKIKDVDFEPRVSNMTWDSTIGIGWSYVVPDLSRMCNYKMKFPLKKYPTVNTLEEIKPLFFCSEFVIWFLHCLGYIKQDYKNFYSFSPGCFLSYTKKLDFIQMEKVWFEEEIIVKRY